MGVEGLHLDVERLGAVQSGEGGMRCIEISGGTFWNITNSSRTTPTCLLTRFMMPCPTCGEDASVHDDLPLGGSLRVAWSCKTCGQEWWMDVSSTGTHSIGFHVVFEDIVLGGAGDPLPSRLDLLLEDP